MAEKSSLGLRIDPEDWLDADLPTVLPAAPDAALLDVDLPVAGVAAWDAVEDDADTADRQLTRAAMARRPQSGGVVGPHAGDESAI
jgi:hypothetical protein